MDAQDGGRGPVTELRVSLTVSDFERLRAFYRDSVGLAETQSWEFHGHGVVFDVGRATLELIDEEHAAFVDDVEVGRPAATGGIRLALAVPDAAKAADVLVAGGAELLGEARETPWGDVNARTRPPEGRRSRSSPQADDEVDPSSHQGACVTRVAGGPSTCSGRAGSGL